MTSQFEFNSVLSSYNSLFGFLTRFSNAHYRILSKTGSEQIEQMSFFRLLDSSIIRCRFRRQTHESDYHFLVFSER